MLKSWYEVRLVDSRNIEYVHMFATLADAMDYAFRRLRMYLSTSVYFIDRHKARHYLGHIRNELF